MRDEKNFYNDKKVKTDCEVGLETKHVLHNSNSIPKE